MVLQPLVSDEIKGVSVINDLLAEQVMYCVCVPDKAIHKDNNDPFVIRLPVRPLGTPKTHETQWEYLIDGLIVRMKPSVLCRSTRPEGDKNVEFELFHNGASWWVFFKLWSELSKGRSEEDGGAWSACYDLNASLLSAA